MNHFGLVCKEAVCFSFILTMLFTVGTDEANIHNGLAMTYMEVEAGRVYG